MTRKLNRGLKLTALTAAVVLTFSACSSEESKDSGDSTSTQSVSESVAKQDSTSTDSTATEPGSETATTQTTSGSTDGSGTTGSTPAVSGEDVDPATVLGPMGEALVNAKTTKGLLRGDGDEADLQLSLEKDKIGARVSGKVDGYQAEILLSSEGLFMKSEDPQAQRMLGGKWLAMKPSDPQGKSLSEAFGSMNPSEMFKDVSSMKAIGEEDVEGKTCRGYEVKIKKSAAGSMATASGEMETMNLWIDPETNLPCKMSSPLDEGELVFTSFGEEIDLTAPPADQQLTMQDALKQQMDQAKPTS